MTKKLQRTAQKVATLLREQGCDEAVIEIVTEKCWDQLLSTIVEGLPQVSGARSKRMLNGWGWPG